MPVVLASEYQEGSVVTSSPINTASSNSSSLAKRKLIPTNEVPNKSIKIDNNTKNELPATFIPQQGSQLQVKQPRSLTAKDITIEEEKVLMLDADDQQKIEAAKAATLSPSTHLVLAKLLKTLSDKQKKISRRN